MTEPDPTVSLRDYVEAILNEERRALVVAEQEREKSARALRDALERSINEGDQNLRSHIEHQIEQVRAALDSAEKLEVQRIGELETLQQSNRRLSDERLAGLQREAAIATAASKEAVDKAEDAIQRRLDLLNEFRGQISEHAEKYAQREVVDAQVAHVNERLQRLENQLRDLL